MGMRRKRTSSLWSLVMTSLQLRSTDTCFQLPFFQEL